MKLGHTVDGLRLGFRCQFGVAVLESIDGAVGRVGEPPGSAQVNDAHPAPKRFRHPFPRLLVGCGKKQDTDASAGKKLPGEWLQFERAASVAIGQLGMNLAQRHAASGHVSFVHAPGEYWGRALETGMPQQQPGQFSAGVPCNSHYRCLHCFGHDSSIVLNRASTSVAW